MFRAACVWLIGLLAVASAQDAPYRTPPDRPIDVTSIHLDLDVDLEAKRVGARARLELTAIKPARGVRLNAVDFRVTGVVEVGADGAEAARSFEHDGQTLWIARSLARGDALTLAIDYVVEDPRGGLHFFGPSEDAPDVPYQVWSQGEPELNRYWIPCVDHPVERQRTSMHVTAAAGLTVISNGTLHGKDTGADGRVTWRYAQEREHVAYLMTLVVGTFDAAEDTWRGKPLGYYVPPGRAEDIPRSFDQTKAMLDLFSELTGEVYPWPKYDQVVVEQFGWGGMENTGATTLNERTLHDARAHLDFSSEGLVAHELAHQWFGDLITCQDWTHVWLNESFATYLAAVWVEHKDGADAFARELLETSDSGRYAGSTRPIADRHYPEPDSMFDGRAYPKGACVLHQLRQRLGDEVFWRGVRLYVSRHKDQSTETTHLRRALEEASGENLERYFHDFVERPGVPELDVRYARDAEQGLITVTIKQTQGGAPYAFPAELVFHMDEGEPLRRVLDVDETEVRLVVAERRAPTWFRFDPREQVLLKRAKVHKPREMWIAQLREDAAMGRMQAARALADDRSPPATEALATCLAEDPFWGVRIEAASALSGNQRDVARAALRAGALEQAHPRVRRACVRALGEQGQHPEAAAALATILTEGDASYYVEAEAVTAYARAAEAPRDLLLRQLDKGSHNDVIQTAALRALEDEQDPSLVSTFAEYSQPGHAPRVRGTAARALAVARLPGASEAQREEATLALRDLLQSSGRRVQRAALDGLHALAGHAREALKAVEAVAQTSAYPNLRDYAGTVAGRIRSGTEPSGELKHLRERLDALDEAKGALEKRLEELEAQQRGAAGGD